LSNFASVVSKNCCFAISFYGPILVFLSIMDLHENKHC
jgi:hypothetical protein